MTNIEKGAHFGASPEDFNIGRVDEPHISQIKYDAGGR